MDTLINPSTGDYVQDDVVVGALKRDPTNGLLNAAYLRLKTPLGSWFGNASLGSRLHELDREKDLARVELLTQQYAKSALKPLLDDGRAQSIDITTWRPGNGHLYMTVEIVDSNGIQSSFEMPVWVV